jgi:hypothetical protein
VGRDFTFEGAFADAEALCGLIFRNEQGLLGYDGIHAET